MLELLSIDNLLTLLMLILLQLVLGFDNLLYVAIESKRAPVESQRRVRQLGIGMAIVLRIILLFVVVQAISLFQDSLFKIDFKGWFVGEFSGHALIVLFGGAFIMWTAVKEITHMLSVHHIDKEEGGAKSVVAVVAAIVLMNLIFSFDSILSAIALAGTPSEAGFGGMLLSSEFLIMAIAIIVTGALMIIMADHVAEFLKQNRMYEVLGLFILFIVGILLVSEGGHLAHIKLFGYPVEAMSKTTFYFVLVFLIAVDVVQSQYQKRLLAQKAHEVNDPKIVAD
ncbi:MAG: tellurium resistance protein TerC [Rhizobiaceae bacterium]|nr:tellurium resistance protein TerC [Rhizobiaceae bacterium]